MKRKGREEDFQKSEKLVYRYGGLGTFKENTKVKKFIQIMLLSPHQLYWRDLTLALKKKKKKKGI